MMAVGRASPHNRQVDRRRRLLPSFATAVGVSWLQRRNALVSFGRTALVGRLHRIAVAACRVRKSMRNYVRMDLSSEEQPLVACGGGGVFFFWQLGAAKAVLEVRNLKRRQALTSRIETDAKEGSERVGIGEMSSGNVRVGGQNSDCPAVASTVADAGSGSAAGPSTSGAPADLGRAEGVVWAGSSAGALCAVLAVCGVCPKDAVKVANSLADSAGVYERPLGLAGVWGSLIREWLDTLLPQDAAERCSSSVSIHITLWRGWRKGVGIERVSHFKDRDALIDSLMASVHIPWFLDGRMWAPLLLRGENKRGMDGSVLGYLSSFGKLFRVSDADLEITSEVGRKPDFFITHLDDLEYVETGPAFTELIGLDSALSMVDRGYSFTRSRLVSVAAGQGSIIASQADDLMAGRESGHVASE